MGLPHRWIPLLLLSAAWCLTPSNAPAQGPSGRLSPDAHVSLVTILPGDPVHTFAGHSALRVRDPKHGLDRLYNYGTFDFSDPLFVPKFLYGHLRYFLSVAPYKRALSVYQQQGRSVIEQRLNLTPQQANTLYRFLTVNAQPENRYYQYDFFFDNCSTRIRDALESTLGDSLAFGNRPNPKKSFSGLLDTYVENRPLLDVGFDLALGLPAMRSPSPREAMFLPEYLMTAAHHATLRANGSRRGLVARTDTVQWIEGRTSSPLGSSWPVLSGVVFLLLVLGWTGWQASTARLPTGGADAALFGTIGIAGCVVCFLWFVSTYTVTETNLNLLWAWPTHLGAAYLLARRPTTNGLRVYLGLTAAGMSLLAVGWSTVPQNLHPALLPIVLGVGVRAAWWTLFPSARRYSVSSMSSTSASPS